jgi:hypothetical protein
VRSPSQNSHRPPAEGLGRNSADILQVREIVKVGQPVWPNDFVELCLRLRDELGAILDTRKNKARKGAGGLEM